MNRWSHIQNPHDVIEAIYRASQVTDAQLRNREIDIRDYMKDEAAVDIVMGDICHTATVAGILGQIEQAHDDARLVIVDITVPTDDYLSVERTPVEVRFKYNFTYDTLP